MKAVNSAIKSDGSNKWCYDNKEENCFLYGGLYNWETAKNACKNGFRLPRHEDFRYVQLKYLGSTESIWDIIAPGGESELYLPSHKDQGVKTGRTLWDRFFDRPCIWVDYSKSSAYNPVNSYSVFIGVNELSTISGGPQFPSKGCYIRCVKE